LSWLLLWWWTAIAAPASAGTLGRTYLLIGLAGILMIGIGLFVAFTCVELPIGSEAVGSDIWDRANKDDPNGQISLIV
jgi:hypothetical protein